MPLCHYQLALQYCISVSYSTTERDHSIQIERANMHCQCIACTKSLDIGHFVTTTLPLQHCISVSYPSQRSQYTHGEIAQGIACTKLSECNYHSATVTLYQCVITLPPTEIIDRTNMHCQDTVCTGSFDTGLTFAEDQKLYPCPYLYTTPTLYQRVITLPPTKIYYG